MNSIYNPRWEKSWHTHGSHYKHLVRHDLVLYVTHPPLSVLTAASRETKEFYRCRTQDIPSSTYHSRGHLCQKVPRTVFSLVGAGTRWWPTYGKQMFSSYLRPDRSVPAQGPITSRMTIIYFKTTRLPMSFCSGSFKCLYDTVHPDFFLFFENEPFPLGVTWHLAEPGRAKGTSNSCVNILSHV